MDSTVKPEATGAHDIPLVRGDDKPTSDYEKVVREELARVQERLAKLANSSAPEPPKPEIAPDVSDRKILNPKILNPKILDPKILDPELTTFRAAAVGNAGVAGEPRSARKVLMRGATALLLAFGAAGAAVAWQSPYADVPKDIIARWAPQLGSILSLPLDKAAPPAESNSPAVQTATADTASQPPPAEKPTQDAAPAAPPPQDATAAAPSATAAAPEPAATQPAAAPQPPTAPQPDVPQLLQSMARDLASLEQGMEQLKASQEQLTRENAKLAEQIKLSQEQMARLVAREHIVRPRAPAPRPVAATRRPVATLPPPQTIAPAHAVAVPPPPAQFQADEPDLTTTLRPPKPVP